MEVVRTVGDYELIFEPTMGMFRLVKTEVSELSMWFNFEIAKEIIEMSEDEFILTAKEYIHQARYAD